MDLSKKGRSSRNKGANGERELANLLRDNWGYETRRGQVFNHQSDIVGLKGIHPEVKRVEKLNVQQAMDQAIKEAQIRNDGIPTVFHRRNNKEWLVTMRLTDWIDLYGAWNK
jgi:Holliday junction resolvase